MQNHYTVEFQGYWRVEPCSAQIHQPVVAKEGVIVFVFKHLMAFSDRFTET